MNLGRMSTSFVIENTELEKYSFNLVHFFLEKEGYSIFNFEEKILENFNHDYYNIIYIYSAPLINDVNIDTLFEKIKLMKKRLQKQFFLFNQSILVIATNCTIDVSKIEVPSHVELINATEQESLKRKPIIKEIYPELINYSLDLSFESLSIKINALSVKYAKKINTIFNKKQFFVSFLLIFLILLTYMISIMLPDIEILQKLILSKTNLKDQLYYTLITNHFVETNLIMLIISIFFIITFGIRLEKIYGSIRFIGIMLLTMVFSNALLLALVNQSTYSIGFSSMIYTYVGSFIYVVIQFRRFLAHMLKRIITLNLFLFLLIIFTGDILDFITLVSALFSGFVASFIIGIPKVKNGNIVHRMLALIFVFILISLSISIGLK